MSDLALLIDGLVDDRLPARQLEQLAGDPRVCDEALAQLAVALRIRARGMDATALADHVLALRQVQPATARNQGSPRARQSRPIPGPQHGRSRRMHSRRGRRTSYVAIPIGSLLIAALLLFLVMHNMQGPVEVAPVDTAQDAAKAYGHIVSGNAEVMRDDQRLSAVAAFALRAGDQLVASPGCTVQLPRSTVSFERVSEFQVGGHVLSRGQARFVVTPGSDVWRMHTPNARVEVLGTAFTVSTDAAVSDVTVHEGRVAMSRRDGSERRVIDAGEAHRIAQIIDDARWHFEQHADGWTGNRLERADGGHALAAVLNKDGMTWVTLDVYNEGKGRPGFDKVLVSASETKAVEFSYRLERPADFIQAQLYCPNKMDNFFWRIDDPIVGTWQTVRVSLLDLKPNEPGSNERIESGDPFNALRIYAIFTGADPGLLVDDIRFVDQ